MAEGLLGHDAGDRFEVESAGTRPGRVRPEAIAVMNELGIDISDHRSKHVDEFLDHPSITCLPSATAPRKAVRSFPINQNAFTWGLKTRQRFKARNKSAWPSFVGCGMKFGIT